MLLKIAWVFLSFIGLRFLGVKRAVKLMEEWEVFGWISTKSHFRIAHYFDVKVKWNLIKVQPKSSKLSHQLHQQRLTRRKRKSNESHKTNELKLYGHIISSMKLETKQ